MSISIDATYSAEDNKLRLYASERLDDETFKKIKAEGFKWASKQTLFVAPKWTPAREDLCITLAGIITPEQTTILERAEAKALRLDNLAVKKQSQSNAFYRAARQIGERFASGQPILIGHHSEKGARRDQQRMDDAMRKSVKAEGAVQYWNWKAEGVEHHAKRKSDPRIRARRIKTLLTELRDHQRDINHAFLCLALWKNIETESDPEMHKNRVLFYAGTQLSTGATVPYLRGKSFWSLLQDNAITHAEVVQQCLVFWDKQSTSIFSTRWITHILNRLAYEHTELGEVVYFNGEITAARLQVFAREHGAHKPKARKEDGKWCLTSSAPLPLHLCSAQRLILDDKQWRELMQSSGYKVPAEKPKKPPILNFKAALINATGYNSDRLYRQITLTKAQYSSMNPVYRQVRISSCGTFRFKVCKHPDQGGYNAEYCAVFLSDSKIHDAIESDAITFDVETV